MPEIAFLLYENMTALDAVGPYEILARLPNAHVKFVASRPGPQQTDVGLVLTADSAVDDMPAPDIVVVPGGPGTIPALKDEAAIEWLRRSHETSTWTTSVCTGSLLLGAAGILEGKRATSHWILRESLRDFDAETRRHAAELMMSGSRGNTPAGMMAHFEVIR